MSRVIDVIRAAWHGRDVYGRQDWCCPVDRAAMVLDWRRDRGEA